MKNYEYVTRRLKELACSCQNGARTGFSLAMIIAFKSLLSKAILSKILEA
jgi:hypothetical protein